MSEQVKTIRKNANMATDILDRLIGAVDVDNYDADEYDVLGRIMVRAGVMWRCVNASCRGINHLESVTCDNCRSRKPPKRSEPKPDNFI